MSARKLQVARDGLVLGEMTDGELLELLHAGFLRPTDQWRGGNDDPWRPVAEFNPLMRQQKPATGWLDRAKTRVADTGTSLTTKTMLARDGLAAKLGGTKTKLVQSRDTFLAGSMDAIQKLVRDVLASKAFRAADSAVRDEAFMRKVFGAVYDCLPKPVCRFVTEPDFIAFCLCHHRRLIDVPETPVESPEKPTATAL